MSQSQVISAPGNLAAAAARRSTRIEKSVPLMVLGQNLMGEQFMERTVSVTLNMHGCRYASRHDYGVGTWVTLQMVGLNNSKEKPATVRAVVRSVHPPESLRELQQVGVELEAPSNVWGIAAPPADWLSAREPTTSTAQLPQLVAPVQESATKEISEIPMKTETKVSEITTSSSPSPAAPASKSAADPQPTRAVVTPEKLIAALQGKLQQEAEKAVHAAAAKQIADLVREALSSLEDARRSSVREMQEFRSRAEETSQRLKKQTDELQRELTKAQEYVDKLMQEVAPSIPAKLKEAMARATSEFENAADEIAELRYERLLENLQGATNEALSKLHAHSVEVQTSVQNAFNSRLEDFRRDTELHVNRALAETKERVETALTSLETESLATCDARRQTLEAEVARSAEHAAEQFHKRIKTFLHTCLEATDAVVDEHSKTPAGKRAKDNH